jgi:hypothetical protein
MVSRYLYMHYYSLINLGLGEIGPTNMIEYLFCMCSMVISSLYFTILFGQVASLYMALKSDVMYR